MGIYGDWLSTQIRSSIFYDADDTGYYCNPNGRSRLSSIDYGSSGYYFASGSWGWRHNTPYGYIEFGPANSSYAHIYTDRPQFYFNVFLEAAGSMRAPIFYDSDNTGYYLNPNGNSNFDTVVTGVMYFASNRNTDSSSAPLQAYSNNGSGATMAFHRSGAYAVNFGLDSDNVMRIGGWSASANRWQLDMSGNMTVAGNVTAYSDVRLKDNIRVIDNALNKLKEIRGVYFTRKDQDDKAKVHTGVIAQEVELVLPEVVSEDNEGKKNVAYGNMVGLLIEAIKEQQLQIEELKALIKK
jgi:hypothetical protein